MNRYISSIEVKEIFHLKDFSIKMDDNFPHLIITGKNGSGKTILLNAIADFLYALERDPGLSVLYLNNYHLDRGPIGDRRINQIDTDYSPNEGIKLERELTGYYRKVSLYFSTIWEIWEQHKEGSFIFAQYGALRDPRMQEPENPTKPNIGKKPTIGQSSTDQFLNFLSDLKIQEALAMNENQKEDADRIKEWFVSFERLLGELYEDENLRMKFNYKDYSFRIETEGKSFKFTELSDGFAAAIDIIADLILKMQQGETVTRAYEKQGIVLIDEIETHLHLSLQKNILRILTKVFPNIQFIVTTHSPFILSSLDNATAFDLEHREPITDLTEYSYESLAEGYFGVKTESSYIGARLAELKELLSKDELMANEQRKKELLIEEFDKIPEMISPLYIGEYRQLMIKEKAKRS